MCGIGGFSGRFDPALLDRINAAQRHRGPDGHGTYHDPENGIGLAHLRLAILDVSDAGLQPMWSDDKKLAISFNGEIYNFRELRASLEQAGHRFRTGTDTEVLLALYRQHGAEMLPLLNGMFTFALWDVERRELLLARDRYGVKPLYYAVGERGFVFASELKALLAEPSVSRAIDPDAIGYLLTYIWIPSPRTPLAAVKKLDQGSAMIIREGRVSQHWRYASLVPSPPIVEQQGEGAYKDRLRQLLEQAVKRQLVADVPVGAFLSGGLDSSAIVALAQRHYADRGAMSCFTMGNELDKGFVADLPYARTAAEALGVHLHEVRVDEDWLSRVPGIMADLDEPIADPAVLNVERICSGAREMGMKVLLSGAGGDDLFSGYRRHVALSLESKWAWLPSPARSAAAKAAGMLPKRNPAARRVRKALEYAHLGLDERLIGYFNWCNPARVRALTGSGTDLSQPLADALSEVPAGHSRLERMLYLEKRFFLADHNLNYTDKASMRHGVEVRVPFLDPDLVDFAASIPSHLKVQGGEPKWIFKRAMEGVLPREIIWRPKTGFGGPLGQWLRGPLKPWLMDQIGARALTGLVNPAETRKLVGELDRGDHEAAYNLFVLVSASAWLGSLS